MKKKLLSGDFKLRSVSGSTSAAWKKFGIVVDTEESTDLDFVGCKSCYHVLAYRRKVTGTTSMNNHKCKVNGQLTLFETASSPKPKTTQLSQDDKHQVTSACVNMVAQDLLPFTIVDGVGFKKFVDKVSILFIANIMWSAIASSKLQGIHDNCL